MLLDVQIIRTEEVRTIGQFERELRVVERIQHVEDVRLLVNVHAKHLKSLVDANNAVRSFTFYGDEDDLAGDTVHVDARASLEIVELDDARLSL